MVGPKGKAPPDLKIPSRETQGRFLGVGGGDRVCWRGDIRSSLPYPCSDHCSGLVSPLPHLKNNKWGETEELAPQTDCTAPPVVAEVGVESKEDKRLQGTWERVRGVWEGSSSRLSRDVTNQS